MMRFAKALHFLLGHIIEAEPDLGKTYLSKVNRADAYMCIWVHLTDIHSMDLHVPREREYEPQLVGFQLSTPMGYVESAHLFWIETKKVKDWANNSLKI